jgi:hypothetical protein
MTGVPIAEQLAKLREEGAYLLQDDVESQAAED